MLLGARSEEEADVFEAEELRQCWTLVHLITMMVMMMIIMTVMVMIIMIVTKLNLKKIETKCEKVKVMASFQEKGIIWNADMKSVSYPKWKGWRYEVCDRRDGK